MLNIPDYMYIYKQANASDQQSLNESVHVNPFIWELHNQFSSHVLQFCWSLYFLTQESGGQFNTPTDG